MQTLKGLSPSHKAISAARLSPKAEGLTKGRKRIKSKETGIMKEQAAHINITSLRGTKQSLCIMLKRCIEIASFLAMTCLREGMHPHPGAVGWQKPPGPCGGLVRVKDCFCLDFLLLFDQAKSKLTFIKAQNHPAYNCTNKKGARKILLLLLIKINNNY
ncbi:hypothetical protein [Mucilaginibacter koreensis]